MTSDFDRLLSGQNHQETTKFSSVPMIFSTLNSVSLWIRFPALEKRSNLDPSLKLSDIDNLKKENKNNERNSPKRNILFKHSKACNSDINIYFFVYKIQFLSKGWF